MDFQIFQAPLKFVFDPINNALAAVPIGFALPCALALFIGTMIWAFVLKKEYVNLDTPKDDIWHDLRFWVVLSMVPHLVVYIYF
jgi:hypothetical protein